MSKKIPFAILLTYCLVLLTITSCSSLINTTSQRSQFTDHKINRKTIQLHNRLTLISKTGIAIGHQDDTAYGLGWNHKNSIGETQSDVEQVTGDFPAIFGFDLGWIEIEKTHNLDTVPFNSMKDLIIDAHKKGGIITISWHINNPLTGGSSWDNSPAVKAIIKGGKEREKYELWVSRLADFISDLTYNNKPIPIIFRPFHEMNGSWFWWGGENCSPKDYKILWQQTVQLLRDKHQLHNILYAFSPNKLKPNDNYLEYYPGDAYVDILGIDIYDFNNSTEYMTSVKHDLAILKKIANEKNKLYAFTETGLESLKTPKWFTEVLYPSIKNTGICWVLTWRNYNTKHHYMPYKGQLNEADFIEFEKLPSTLFLKDINKLN